jgi:ubiquinone/menaquinone biosynthesis C-methylase UbiE
MDPQQLPSPADLYENFYGPAIFGPLSEQLLGLADAQPGERALDLACGTGIVARQLAQRVAPGGAVLAVDINPAMLEVARRMTAPGAPISFLEADATTLELPPASLQLATCQQGLQFFPDRVGALQRVRAALAGAGRLVLACWRGIPEQTLMADFAEVEARHLEPLGVTYDDIAAPFSLGDPDELEQLLHEAGFGDSRVEARQFTARFASPATFARSMETAYAAVIPAFASNPDAFAAYLDAVERDSTHIVERYTRGGSLEFAMPTLLAVARP